MVLAHSHQETVAEETNSWAYRHCSSASCLRRAVSLKLCNPQCWRQVHRDRARSKGTPGVPVDTVAMISIAEWEAPQGRWPA
jgi:hypothetical protein